MGSTRDSGKRLRKGRGGGTPGEKREGPAWQGAGAQRWMGRAGNPEGGVGGPACLVRGSVRRAAEDPHGRGSRCLLRAQGSGGGEWSLHPGSHGGFVSPDPAPGPPALPAREAWEREGRAPGRLEAGAALWGGDSGHRTAGTTRRAPTAARREGESPAVPPLL